MNEKSLYVHRKITHALVSVRGRHIDGSEGRTPGTTVDKLKNRHCRMQVGWNIVPCSSRRRDVVREIRSKEESGTGLCGLSGLVDVLLLRIVCRRVNTLCLFLA